MTSMGARTEPGLLGADAAAARPSVGSTSRRPSRRRPPHHPSFRPAAFKQLVKHDDVIDGKPAGFTVHEYNFVGQWGHPMSIPRSTTMPACAIRTRSRSRRCCCRSSSSISPVRRAADPDTCVQLSDVDAWERRWGRIPEGAFVALRSDWSKRWPDQARMVNADGEGIGHHPGWSLPVLRRLFEDRAIRACGHETTDTDPGIATSRNDYSLERYVLGRNCWQIEMLTNLDQVPEAGALIVADLAPKPKKAPASPPASSRSAPQEGT